MDATEGPTMSTTHDRNGKFKTGHPPLGRRPKSIAKAVRKELASIDVAVEVRRLRETDPAAVLQLAHLVTAAPRETITTFLA